MKYISRINRPRSGYGWLVRYQGQGKWFADSKYGDSEKALVAARFYLIERKRKNPLPPGSGVPGVIKSYIRVGDKKVPCFVVQFKQAGIFKRFYPHHYASEQEALVEAAKFRHETQQELLRIERRQQETNTKSAASMFAYE